LAESFPVGLRALGLSGLLVDSFSHQQGSVALENARLESVVSLLHESKRRDTATLRQGQPQGGHGGTANLAPNALCRSCDRGYGIKPRGRLLKVLANFTMRQFFATSGPQVQQEKQGKLR